ncbi:hypothetical protein [Desulfovibrio ferrophilus]|uniref:Uncharacterized protein n=1 Tax=Desulfovibrio ferrophilus TaxID=241368 RepID=A0A2Z6AUF9_9BACT|nr:hypothetical protein [Desulfovibrio ferrophilus]BBD06872.1 uncharacterized protein DFE_0146 [Desulfovibrio ferrophilus]
MSRLGNWLEWQTTKAKAWRNLLFSVLGALAVVGALMHNHHPHFGLDELYVFWAGFGWVLAVVMTIVLKKIIFPILKKPEDYYDRDK